MLLLSNSLAAQTEAPHAKVTMFMNKPLMLDMAKTWGWHHSQTQQISGIRASYPSLRRDVDIAEMLFDRKYGDSLNNIKKHMASYGINTESLEGGAWQTHLMTARTLEEAHLFVKQVRARVDGDIEQPMLGMLRAFKPVHMTYPETEFVMGYREKMILAPQSAATLGLTMSVEIPHSYRSKPPNRPHIAAMYTNMYGNGPVSFTVIVSDVTAIDQRATEIDEAAVRSAFLPNIESALLEGVKNIDNIRVMSKAYHSIEGLPGLKVTYGARSQQMGRVLSMEIVTYMLFYKGKKIMLQGMVGLTLDSKPMEFGGVEKHLRLFEMMAHSFVLHDRWVIP